MIENEDEFLLDSYKQEEILTRIREYSKNFFEIADRIIKTGAYYQGDGSRIDDLADKIANENKTLYCFYELKKEESDE